MNIVFFCHAVTSCWNNGNAHFLRGVTRELARLGHRVTVYEPEDGWSRLNAIRDGGADVLQQAKETLAGVDVRSYRQNNFDLDQAIDHADAVVVHEWTADWLLDDIRERRLAGGRFRLLFHDTHHRAVTAPEQIDPDHLDGFDAALVFGEALRDVYLRRALAARVVTWHEAADTRVFKPVAGPKSCDLIWIGNWGDEERSSELREFLVEPAGRLKLPTHVYGVRYPAHALALLEAHGLYYRGWIANLRAPQAFGRARVTVHIPRGPYVRALPGIPTIRVFEALACGIPLICSPWSDCEGLFPPGCYLTVTSGRQMTTALADVLNDDELALDLMRRGFEAIAARHTCAHRAQELVDVLAELSSVPACIARLPQDAQVASP